MLLRPAKNIIAFVFIYCIMFNNLLAQSYHGPNSSPYFGVSNIYVNPASSVNGFYKWDVSLVGLQFTTSQNTGYLQNASLTNSSTISDSSLKINEGYAQRYYHGILDGQGFSIRYKFNDNHAIAFAIRGRTYNHFKSNSLFYNDSIKTLHNFLKANLSQPFADFFYTHAGWIEANLNYAQTLYKDNYSKLTVGATVGLCKALSGLHFAVRDFKYQQQQNSSTGRIYYQPSTANIEYMYSANLAMFDTVKVSSNSINRFLKNSATSLSLSVGAEYLISDEDAEDDLNTRNYKWKIGAAIMDIGKLKFTYAKGSASHTNPNNSFTDTIFDAKFNAAKTLEKFRDSMATIFYNTDSLNGLFSIALPTHLVLSIDRNLGNGFYVNAEADISFRSVSSTTKINTREINLFTVTPRWETQLVGVYLPVQYNTQGNLWVGAAVKIGPVILGIHDFSVLSWSKKKDQTINSGAYFMLNIYPYKTKRKIDGEIKCPVM